MSDTAVKPLSSFYSTNLNPVVNSYDRLATRIAYTMGYPQINVEAHQNQVYEFISIAIEMFTKFAGYTEEFLVFHSDLYDPGQGVRMDVLLTATDQMEQPYEADPKTTTLDKSLYEIGKATIGGGPIDYAVSYKGFSDGTHPKLVANTRNNHSSSRPGDSNRSQTSDDVGKPFPNQPKYDYLTDSYRKVVDVFAFEEGSTSGINTLFTIEQTLAQQTYFSYAMGKYGFDLISWFTLKNWLDTRRKLLSQEYYWRFNERRQRLLLTPEPNLASIESGRSKAKFYGVVGAYVEKPVIDLVVEPWVYQYSLALTKIAIGRIRGKYSGTNLFGGGSPNYQEMLSEGNEEKKALEERLYENVPGFGDGSPPLFFVG